jgi:hypothetical protein
MGVAWRPESMAEALETGPPVESYSYIVLEEIVDGVALLVAWPWPHVDDVGRLFWPATADASQRTATINVGLLRAQLYDREFMRREPRCGDTYAATGVGRSHRRLADLRRWLTGSVYDISADTHEAARIAYRSGLAAVPAARPEVQPQLTEAARRRSVRQAPALVLTAPPTDLAQ